MSAAFEHLVRSRARHGTALSSPAVTAAEAESAAIAMLDSLIQAAHSRGDSGMILRAKAARAAWLTLGEGGVRFTPRDELARTMAAFTGAKVHSDLERDMVSREYGPLSWRVTPTVLHVRVPGSEWTVTHEGDQIPIEHESTTGLIDPDAWQDVQTLIGYAVPYCPALEALKRWTPTGV